LLLFDQAKSKEKKLNRFILGLFFQVTISIRNHYFIPLALITLFGKLTFNSYSLEIHLIYQHIKINVAINILSK